MTGYDVPAEGLEKAIVDECGYKLSHIPSSGKLLCYDTSVGNTMKPLGPPIALTFGEVIKDGDKSKYLIGPFTFEDLDAKVAETGANAFSAGTPVEHYGMAIVPVQLYKLE